MSEAVDPCSAADLGRRYRASRAGPTWIRRRCRHTQRMTDDKSRADREREQEIEEAIRKGADSRPIIDVKPSEMPPPSGLAPQQSKPAESADAPREE